MKKKTSSSATLKLSEFEQQLRGEEAGLSYINTFSFEDYEPSPHRPSREVNHSSKKVLKKTVSRIDR